MCGYEESFISTIDKHIETIFCAFDLQKEVKCTYEGV